MRFNCNYSIGAQATKKQQYQKQLQGLILAFSSALVLTACADTSRFSGDSWGSGLYSSPRVISAPVDDVVPLPGGTISPEIISAPLPPAENTSMLDNPLLPPGAVSPPLEGGSVQTDAVFTNHRAQTGTVASLPPTSTPATGTTLTRTSMTGSWKASEAAGGSCRVVLSSAPSLDLYKASSNGCVSQDMKSVNAWDLRGNEIYLYARGNVVARLRGGGSNFSGVLAKSGAPVTLSR